jgi:hypothetical protein
VTIIQDPRRPALLFDGNVKVLSTCRACGQLMQITNVGEKVHPTCNPPEPTILDSLAQGWLSAILAEDYEAAKLTRKELIERAAEPPDLRCAAVQYAEWGWPVFPLAQHSKQPAIPKSKGGTGFKQATSDVARIDKWWCKHADHNVGLATGWAFDAIDIDSKNGGVQSFITLLADKRLPETHGIAVTASGGMHLYVKPTGKGNYAGLRPGVDYRGKGGYVVAPPSTLGTPGRDYTWLIDPSPKLKGGGGQ